MTTAVSGKERLAQVVPDAIAPASVAPDAVAHPAEQGRDGHAESFGSRP